MFVQDVFPTNLGWMAVALGSQGLLRLVFDQPSDRAARQQLNRDLAAWPQEAKATAPSLARQLQQTVEQLQRYAAGEAEPLVDIAIDWSHLTPFQVRVLKACRRIPWGQTRTYADLARQVGSPNAARAIGGVMARNRIPLVIPCHRVVASGGELGGFSSRSGLKMKRKLLQLEQVGALV